MKIVATHKTSPNQLLAAAAIFLAIAFLAVFNLNADNASPGDEKERLAAFLNLFTQQHYYNMDADKLSTEEMIEVAIINNYYSSKYYTQDEGAPDTIKVVTNKDGEKELTLKGIYVDKAIKQLFGKTVTLIGVDPYVYDGETYTIGIEGSLGDVGDAPEIVVTEIAKRADGIIDIKGYWEPLDDDPKKLSVTAVVRPNEQIGGDGSGEYPWSLVSLALENEN
jgi:hypothetical protein